MNNHTQIDITYSHLHKISISNRRHRAPSKPTRLHARLHAVELEFGERLQSSKPCDDHSYIYALHCLSIYVFDKNLFRINLLKKYMFVFYILGR
jgi:hypothetical protein